MYWFLCDSKTLGNIGTFLFMPLKSTWKDKNMQQRCREKRSAQMLWDLSDKEEAFHPSVCEMNFQTKAQRQYKSLMEHTKFFAAPLFDQLAVVRQKHWQQLHLRMFVTD